MRLSELLKAASDEYDAQVRRYKADRIAEAEYGEIVREEYAELRDCEDLQQIALQAYRGQKQANNGLFSPAEYAIFFIRLGMRMQRLAGKVKAQGAQ